MDPTPETHATFATPSPGDASQHQTAPDQTPGSVRMLALRPSPFALENCPNDTSDLPTSTSDSKSHMAGLDDAARRYSPLSGDPSRRGNATGTPDDGDKLSADSVAQILQIASAIESLSLVSCIEAGRSPATRRRRSP
ncbi:hypothetical protein CLOP_g8816 [Closterium sp. NIES-67]|nr:hypothetical protein CLOP_g8816 [Closterium sp. NIES-67]